MKTTFSVLFYLKRSGQKANGNMPVMGRITVNGQAVQFGAKIDIRPELWNVTAGKAVGKGREVQEINQVLEGIKATMTKIYRDLREREKDASPQKIKNIFFGIEQNFYTLIQVFDKHNQDFEKLVGVSKCGNTLQKYKRTKGLLEGYIKSQYNLSDIPLNEVNHQFVQNFDVYLRTAHHHHHNTVAKNMRRFKTVIIYAKNNDWLRHEPFGKYIISFVPSDRGYLTQDELEIIINKEFKIKRLEQVRDLFIFSCYSNLTQ